MKSKRVGAKLIDIIIFIFLSGIFCGVSFMLVDSLLQNYNLIETVTQITTDLSTMDYDAITQYITENRNQFFVFSCITYVSMLLFGVIYFGLIGSLVKGSLGKYVLKLTIVKEESSEKVNPIVLALREPFLHIQFISLIILVATFLFPNLLLINIFQFLYLILFILDKDFWNKIFKVKIEAL